jgi:hypothetical protein
MQVHESTSFSLRMSHPHVYFKERLGIAIFLCQPQKLKQQYFVELQLVDVVRQIFPYASPALLNWTFYSVSDSQHTVT